MFNALALVESKTKNRSTYVERVKKSESYGGDRKQRKEGTKKKEEKLKIGSPQ
jgi:hypothetical protein